MKLNQKRIKFLITNAALLGLSLLLGEETIHELDPYSVISQTRTEKGLSTIPQTVSLLDAASWDGQLGLSLDPVAAISQLVPSFSPSRQKMTGFGETFRGRSPLYMVDGIPQSNPLRDGSRDGYTVDSAVIDRIEVIHGASAAQGLGATGGIINFITIAPPAEDGMANQIEVGSEFSDELNSEGTGFYGSATSRYREGAFGYAAALSYKWRPMSYDGDGNLIGIDNTQGDTMNSETLDYFGKFVYSLSANQEVEVLFNHFTLEQDLEYVSVAGDPDSGIPTTSQKGTTPGKATQNDVTSANLTYTHEAFMGGALKLNAFYRDFAATYGGGTFGVFTFNGERIFDQSQNESEKRGFKISHIRDVVEPFEIGLVAGIDYIEDETRQVLVQTGREWVPPTEYSSVAPYVQLEKVLGSVVLSGGLRYEDAELAVADFTTLEAYGSQDVAGGNPGFSEWLLNIGLTWEAAPGYTVFASFNEGFGMPDVGRVLRGINEPGQSVEDFLNLQPVVTDNYEIGLRHSSESFSLAGSLFFSESELGNRLSADADGIFLVNREKTETYGIELSGNYKPSNEDSFEARFALVEGKFDADDNGSVDTRLDGTNIPPARLNLGWTRAWTEEVSSRLQSSTYFDRDAPTASGSDFSGYTLVDLLMSYRINPDSRIDIGIANLLDKQYVTYYSQTSGNASRYFAGRGRTLNLRYTLTF